MESYRVYKSLPLDDFMNNVQFIVAKCGLLITPIIQDINYLKHNDLHSEHYWKQHFMNKVQNMLIKEKDNLNCDIDVTDMGSFGYWTFIPRRKESIQYLISQFRKCLNIISIAKETTRCIHRTVRSPYGLQESARKLKNGWSSSG